MHARTTLKLIVCASTVVSVLLGHLAYLHVQALNGLPGSTWGSPQLSSALLTTLSALGAVAAAWYGLSALLALVATLPSRGLQHRHLPSRLSSQAARYLLQRWGAPAVRRLAAGSLVLSLGASPALAAEAPPYDLGWQPSSTATVQPQTDGEAASPERPETPVPPAATAGPTHSPASEAPTPPAATAPGPAPTTPAPAPSLGPSPGAGPSAVPQAPAATTPSAVPAPAATAADGAADPARAGGTAGAGPRTPPAQHTVRPGESLWSISASHLGLGNSAPELVTAWPQLYQHNQETVGPDPSLIQPGMVLDLPWDQP